MTKVYTSRDTYKIKYEKLLKKWQAELVKVKILTDINDGLTKQLKVGITTKRPTKNDKIKELRK